MATLTIRDLPDDIHARLKARAEENHRSLNREAIACLEQQLGGRPIDAEHWLPRLQALRERVRLPLSSDEDVERAINEGRK